MLASSAVPLGPGGGVDMRGIVPQQCYTVLRAYEWRPLPPRPGATGHGLLTPAERIADPESAACGSVRLLRLRNPWGQREWSGPWADGSAYWGSHDVVRREVEGFGDVGQEAADDGDFWISLPDFARRFTALHACREFAEMRHGGEWFKYAADAEWSVSSAGGRPTTQTQRKSAATQAAQAQAQAQAQAAESAGLASTAHLNPHFVLRVSKPTRVVVVLTQCRQASRRQGEQVRLPLLRLLIRCLLARCAPRCFALRLAGSFLTPSTTPHSRQPSRCFFCICRRRAAWQWACACWPRAAAAARACTRTRSARGLSTPTSGRSRWRPRCTRSRKA